MRPHTPLPVKTITGWLILLAALTLYSRAATEVEDARSVLTREKIRKALESDGLYAFQGGDVRISGTITCPQRYQAGIIRADKPTRIFQGPPGSGPLFRLRGSHMSFSGPLQIIGNGKDPIFEVEGNFSISTGCHVFRDLQILNAPTDGVWVALKGRYEFDDKTSKTGKFIEDVNHADMCRVEGCGIVGKSYTIFRSDNLQALRWSFRDCSANFNSDDGKGDAIAAKLNDGGCVSFDGLTINHPRFTIFEVHGVSKNTCYATCTNLYCDAPTARGSYLTVLDDSKVSELYAKDWGSWILDVRGFVPRNGLEFDHEKLFTKRALYDKERSRVSDLFVSGAE